MAKPKAINREKVGRFCFAQYRKSGQAYRGRSPLCRSAEDAIPLLWVQGRSALLGSRGNAHWRVKGGSPYRVKGETPCPARVGACANSYWVYYLTQEPADSAAKLPFPQREN